MRYPKKMTDRRRAGSRTLAPDEARRVKDAIGQLLKKSASQRDLAKRLECSPQAISRITLGELPGQTLAHKVAKALGVSLEALLRGQEADDADVYEPRFGSLLGWAEAEAVARKRYRNVPEWAWEKVRGLRGGSAPRVVTPEWIGLVAMAYSSTANGDDGHDPD